MPRTRFQFPDGSILCVGTVSGGDQIHQAVYKGRAIQGMSMGGFGALNLAHEYWEIPGIKHDLPRLSAWIGLVLLALMAVAFLAATIRVHPPGGRLVPFACAGLGGVAGLLLWMHWLGPLLLP